MTHTVMGDFQAEQVLRTKVETANGALGEVAAREQRLPFLDDLDELAVDLADPEVMRGAWRS